MMNLRNSNFIRIFKHTQRECCGDRTYWQMAATVPPMIAFQHKEGRNLPSQGVLIVSVITGVVGSVFIFSKGK
jgi:hypothetical protein